MIGWSHSVSVTPDEPAGDLTDFAFVVPIPLLPAEWIAAAKPDMGDVRVTLADGVTEVPCYVHRPGSGGLVFFKHSPLAAGAGTIRLHAGNASASASTPAAGDPNGRFACFDGGFYGYWPDGLGNDLTSRLNHLTAVGSPPAANATNAPFAGAFSTLLDGATQYGVATATPISGQPIYMSALGRSASLTAAQTPISCASSAGNNQFLMLEFRGDDAGPPADPIRAFDYDNVDFGAPRSAVGYQQNVWTVGTAEFASSSSRTARINGGNAASDASPNVDPIGVNRIGVGALVQATPNGFFNGRLAFAQIHNVVRGANWDAYSAAMLLDPSAFYSIGSVVITGEATGGVSYSPRRPVAFSPAYSPANPR
jgi:hypothetical protein